MHLHFVQSLEPLQGAGLGQAALSLHLAMRGLGGGSFLLSTRAAGFTPAWPDVLQGVRRGPDKAYCSPELKRLAGRVVERADWFHGHGLYVWTNMWLGGEARRRGKPLVYHPQGFFDPWILRRSRWKKRIAHWLFEDRNIARVRLWRAVSCKEADQIRAVAGSHAVVHVIPNGIDIDEVDSAEVTSDEWRVTAGSGDAAAGKVRDERPCSSAAAIPDDPADRPCHDFPWAARHRPKRVLFLSRIHPKKGLDLLVPAWARLTRGFPDWELLVVGPDEGGYQATVVKMMADCGCAETCWIHPAVSGAEKHALLRTADLFVLPSYSEGFPMAVLEAAAHRLPVVQTTECNFPELAVAGGAWECRPELDAVESTLREALAAGDAERRDRGAQGRRLVERHYTWDKLARDLHDACRALAL